MGEQQQQQMAMAPMAAARSSGVSWKAPVTMFVMLVLGLALAIAQHLFYRYLDGKQVSETLKQNWVVRIGTLIAFLSKTAFVVAASIGYAQRQWLNLKKRAFKMAQVDDLTSALSDIFALFNFVLWTKAPILFLIALVIWLLPLVAIFTPGSIIVTSRQSNVASKAAVSQLSWNNSAYSIQGPVDTDMSYEQPQKEVFRAAWASASSAGIISIPHPETNMTYNLVFNAPALKCFAANATVQSNINANFGFEGSGGGADFECMVPGGDGGALSSNNMTIPDSNPKLDIVSLDTARIFASSMAGSACPLGTPSSMGLCFNTTECNMYNATYNVNFTFSGAVQNITINKIDFLDMLPAFSAASVTTPGGATTQQILTQAYQGVMYAFGTILVGDHDTGGAGSSQFQLTNIDWTTVDGMNNGMQELFQNMTISMMNQQPLLLNPTQALAQAVPVTLQNWPPTYDYQPFDLYLTYGLAFGFALICTLVGWFAIVSNGATYSNKFSTYIRSTRDEELSRTLNMHHSADDGSNPLPVPIARTRIVINGDVTSKGGEEYQMLPR